MIRALPDALVRSCRGAAAIEFAMLVPVLVLLVCGTIDLGYVYMAQVNLSNSLAAAARGSSATQERTEAEREAEMRARVTEAMQFFRAVPEEGLEITTKVYANFSGTRPEDYTDVNSNGRYDGPQGVSVGEPFTDRNRNGQWDPELPIEGSTVGSRGEVVNYTATYKVQHLFSHLVSPLWNDPGVTLTATSVVRNEPVRTE